MATPSVAVAAVVGEEMIYSEAAGGSSVESTAYMCASISKTVAAVACMQCKERGVLDLDIDINRYTAPHGVKVSNPAFPLETDFISARHLLTHSSGLIDDEGFLLPGPFRSEGDDCPVSLRDYVLRHLCPQGDQHDPASLWGSSSPPGKAPYHYSNAGISLLGYVIECAGASKEGSKDDKKKSLAQLAQEGIFTPLGMSHTSYSLSDLQARTTDVAVPHTADGCSVGHYGVAQWPAAGLRSSAGDLAKFLLAFTGVANPLLRPESVAEMLPASFTRGLAWWGKDASYGNRSLKGLSMEDSRGEAIFIHYFLVRS
jgi:serine-type D-Ala-D-Ala carboxypeptidase/endopeptidase